MRYSVNAIRRLLATTVLTPTVNILAAIEREHWRMVHKTRAMISSYRGRGDPLPRPLQLRADLAFHQDLRL
jgi:hypothetical protein